MSWLIALWDRWERERIENANHGPSCEIVWFQRHEKYENITAVVNFKNNQYFWRVHKRTYKPTDPIEASYESSLPAARDKVRDVFRRMDEGLYRWRA